MTPEQLQKILSQNLGYKLSQEYSDIHFVIEGDILILEGSIDSKAGKALIGKELSAFLPFRIIVNNLSIDHDKETRKRVMSRTIYFPLGSSLIPETERHKLISNIDILKKMNYQRLYILGHADIIESKEKVMGLANKRASNVRGFLIENGLDRKKIIAIELIIPGQWLQIK